MFCYYWTYDIGTGIVYSKIRKVIIRPGDIKYDKKYTRAYNNRGSLFSKKGEMDLAISDFNKALEIDPKCFFAYLNRGNLYYAKDDLLNALDDFDKALMLYPGHKYALEMKKIIIKKLNKN